MKIIILLNTMYVTKEKENLAILKMDGRKLIFQSCNGEREEIKKFLQDKGYKVE